MTRATQHEKGFSFTNILPIMQFCSIVNFTSTTTKSVFTPVGVSISDATFDLSGS